MKTIQRWHFFSKDDTFSPNFFPEVHRLLPHILTIAPCCRQHFSGCQLLITPSNLDFWWFLSQLGSKKTRFLFRWSQASAFCGFHFIPWNILPFSSCMWKAILHPVWPCKQVKLQLCLQPSHWQGSDPSPSSWDSWRQVLGGLLEVLLIWLEVRGEHTSPWPHVKVGGRESPFQRNPHLPIFSTSISLYCQGQWWVHERQSIYTLSRSRVTWEYWLPIVLISALRAWPKMKREVPFEYLVSLDFIPNN